MTTTVSLLAQSVHFLNSKFFYTKPRRLRNESCQGKHLTASVQSFLIPSTALRAYRNRHLGTLMRSCETWKPIEDRSDTFSFDCFDFQRFSQIILALLAKTLRHVKLSPQPSLGRKQKKTLLWLDAGVDNVPGATRNLC